MSGSRKRGTVLRQITRKLQQSGGPVRRNSWEGHLASNLSGVGTLGGLNRRRSRPFAEQVQFILFAVHRPPFFERMYLLGRSDTESGQRQDHGSHADMRRRSWADVSAVPTSENRRTDIPFQSKSLEHRVKVVS